MQSMLALCEPNLYGYTSAVSTILPRFPFNPTLRRRITRRYVKTYAVDVNTSRTPEEGAHIPSWPNGLIIIIIYHSHSCAGSMNIQ